VIFMANAHVRMLASGQVRIERLADKATEKITKQVFREIQRRVPVDTGELLDSLGMTVVHGTGIITVGTEHWAAVEYGTKPHIIRSGGDYSLHNRETGQRFGKVVHHPGTPAQPYIRPAVYKKRAL
jgi:bacteriophage HK97-gp10 putative tail-component